MDHHGNIQNVSTLQTNMCCNAEREKSIGVVRGSEGQLVLSASQPAALTGAPLFSDWGGLPQLRTAPLKSNTP